MFHKYVHPSVGTARSATTLSIPQKSQASLNSSLQSGFILPTCEYLPAIIVVTSCHFIHNPHARGGKSKVWNIMLLR